MILVLYGMRKNLFSCLMILQHPLVNDVNIIHVWPDESSHPIAYHPRLNDSGHSFLETIIQNWMILVSIFGWH